MADTAQLQPAAQTAGISLIDNQEVSKMADQLTAIANFQSMVEKNLKKDQDYGVIPGTQKPTLLKPGAEKIQMLMGVTSEYEVLNQIEDYDKGFFSYTVRATLSKNGTKITEGLGSANTKEKRYINQDAFMLVNTVLKMAKKRAQVDATLTIASLSNVFTQDIEDMDNFNQQEQTDTMTLQDAAATKLTFGKNKGKTLGGLANDGEGKSYLKWLSENAKQAPLKQAASMVLNPPETSTENKADANGEKLAGNDLVNELADKAKEYAKQMGIDKPEEVAVDFIQKIDSKWAGDWQTLTEATVKSAIELVKKEIKVNQAEEKDPFADADDGIDPEDVKLPF